jgi:hypothetical protein
MPSKDFIVLSAMCKLDLRKIKMQDQLDEN